MIKCCFCGIKSVVSEYSLSMENKKSEFYSKPLKTEEHKGQNTLRFLYGNEYKEIPNRLEEYKSSNVKKIL